LGATEKGMVPTTKTGVEKKNIGRIATAKGNWVLTGKIPSPKWGTGVGGVTTLEILIGRTTGKSL